MTTTATFPSLHPPAQEDSMDMSSPALYDDIEIDFDEQPGGVDLHVTDPDRMTDDGEHTRPGTATDLMMEDDLQVPDSQVPEQDMQDDFDPVRYEAEDGDGDDDLIDYDDEVYDDTPVVGDQPGHGTMGQAETYQEQPVVVDVSVEAEAEQADEEITRQPEDLMQHPPVAIGETILEEVPAPEESYPEVETSASPVLPTADHEETPHTADADIEPAPAPAIAAADEKTELVRDVHDCASESHDERLGPENVQDAHVPPHLNTSLSVATDAPGTPTDTGLHPMTICYGDSTLPLFKSKNALDGLLKNDNLVNVSLAELLNNCRQRISIKLHEDVPEDMDLILLFDGLNLSVTESDHQCSVITLNEVLNVYTQLHANEGFHDIPPFSLTLYTQSKFSSAFNILKQGADAGHGISAYIDDTVDQDEDEDFTENFTGDYQDQTEENAPGIDEDGNQGHHDDEQSYHDNSAAEGQEYGSQDEEVTTAYEGAADGEGDPSALEHEDTVAINDATESQAPDDLTHDQEEYLAEPERDDVAQEQDAKNHAENLVDGAKDIASGAQPVHLAQAEDEGLPHEVPGENEEDGGNVESGASSTTLRADHAEDAVELGFDGHDDYSTFLTGTDEEESAAGQPGPKIDASGVVPEMATGLEEEQNTGEVASASNSTTEALADFNGTSHAVDDGLRSYDEDETLGFDAGDVSEYFDTHQDNGFGAQQDYEEYPEDFHTGQDFVDGADPDELDGANVETAKAMSAHEKAVDDNPEDNIDFDDDTEEQHEARMASVAGATPGSPSGKRSFDATESLYDNEDEPELKKARSS